MRIFSTLIVGLLLSSNLSFAATTSGFPAAASPAYTGAQTNAGLQSVGAAFTACGTIPVQLPSILQAMAPQMISGSGLPSPTQCLGGGALQAAPIFSPTMQCNGSSEIRAYSDLSCDDIVNPESVSQTLMLQKRTLTEAACAAECKIGKSAAVQSEMTCLSQAMSQLSQALQNAELQMNQLYKQDQAQVKQITMQIGDLTTRQEFVQKKLAGDPTSGRPGLIQMAEDVKGAYDSLTVQIQQTKAAVVQLNADQQLVGQSKKLVTSARMMKCISSTPFAQFKCGQTGEAAKPQTTLDYMSCRYRQTQAVTPGNYLDRSNFAKQAGVAAGSGLDAILDQIRAGTPVVTDFPTDKESMSKFTSQGASALTIDQISSQYKQQLQSMKVGNLNLWSFLSAQLSVCEQKAKQSVSIEEETPQSQLFELKKNIKLGQNNITAVVQQQLAQNNKVFQAASGVMNAPGTLNISQCENGTTATAVGCLENMRGKFQALLGGAPNPTPYQFPIQGAMNTVNGANSNFQGLTCYNLSQCVQGFQSMAQNLGTTIKQGQQIKDQYVFAANQKMKDYANVISQQLMGPNAQLRQKLGQLSREISALGGGVSGGSLGQDKMIPSAEDFQTDQDGLATPGKLKNYLSKQMNGLLDFSNGNSLNDAASSLGKVQAKESHNLNLIAESFSRMKQLEIECPRKAAKDILAGLQTDVNEIQNANCSDVWGGQANCDARLDQLFTTIGELSSGSSTLLSPISLQSLQNGRLRACPPSMKQMRADQNRKITAMKAELTQVNAQLARARGANRISLQARHDALTRDIEDLSADTGMMMTMSAGARGVCDGVSATALTKAQALRQLSKAVNDAKAGSAK